MGGGANRTISKVKRPKSTQQGSSVMAEATIATPKAKTTKSGAFEMPKFEMPKFDMPKVEMPAAFREFADAVSPKRRTPTRR